jgi:hypothetical protein
MSQVEKVKKLEQGVKKISEGWETLSSAGLTTDIRIATYFHFEATAAIFRLNLDKLRFACVLAIAGGFCVAAIFFSLPVTIYLWLRFLFGLLVLGWAGLFCYYMFMLRIVSKALETLTKSASEGYTKWMLALFSDLNTGIASKKFSLSDLSTDLTSKLLAAKKASDPVKPDVGKKV